MTSTAPIGVFDSGLGGISVAREIRRDMPNERVLYFGDSANAPYGTKSPEQVRKLSDAIVKRFVEQGVKAVGHRLQYRHFRRSQRVARQIRHSDHWHGTSAEGGVRSRPWQSSACHRRSYSPDVAGTQVRRADGIVSKQTIRSFRNPAPVWWRSLSTANSTITML